MWPLEYADRIRAYRARDRDWITVWAVGFKIPVDAWSKAVFLNLCETAAR